LIASIRGTVLSKKPEAVIIEAGGIGYRVSVPLRSLADIPESGSTVFMHIYTHVREDALQLFGFLSEDERRVFTTLIGISGIGPKLGLAVLSGMPVRRFAEAVNNEDVALLSTIPGLGGKTASRIILELKGKLPSLGIGEEAALRKPSAADDAVSALVNLGYRRPSSENAVNASVKNGAETIEDIIKEALKHLTK